MTGAHNLSQDAPAKLPRSQNNTDCAAWESLVRSTRKLAIADRADAVTVPVRTNRSGVIPPCSVAMVKTRIAAPNAPIIAPKLSAHTPRAGEQSGGDDGGGTDTRAGRHSQQVGIGESVTDEGLHHRAGDGKTSADGQTEQYPRCSDPPHDRKFGTRDGWASEARVHHVHHSGHGEHLGSERQRAHSREHGDDHQSGQHDTRTESSSRCTSLRRRQVGRWRQSSANSIHGVTDPSSWHDTTSTRVVSGYGRRQGRPHSGGTAPELHRLPITSMMTSEP